MEKTPSPRALSVPPHKGNLAPGAGRGKSVLFGAGGSAFFWADGGLQDGGEKLVDKSGDGRVGLVGMASGAEEFAGLVAVDDEELPAGTFVPVVQEERSFATAWEHGIEDEFVFEPEGSAFAGGDDQMFNELDRVDGGTGEGRRGHGRGLSEVRFFGDGAILQRRREDC